jgi:hypothetical protein
MSRPGGAFYGALTIAVAALGIVCWAARPTWRPATDAEVRSVLNPLLLEATPSDPAARRRFREVSDTVQALGLADFTVALNVSPAPKRPEMVRDFVRRCRPQLRRLAVLSGEGPLEGPPPARNRQDLPLVTVRVYGLPCLAQIAEARARDGNAEEAGELLALAARLFNRLDAASQTLGAHVMASSERRRFEIEVGRSLPRYGEIELGKLAAELHGEMADDPALRRVFRNEFQTYLLPVLSDPGAYFRREYPNEDPDRLLSSLVWTGKEDAPGNYEAVPSAQEADRVVGGMLENLRRPWAKQDPRPSTYHFALGKRVPPPTSPGKTGLRQWWARLSDRVEMRRVPNSIGAILVHRLTLSPNPIVAESFFDRTRREGFRAKIALRRYQLRHHRRAPSLQALVDEGFLNSLPSDFFGNGPLHYDASRGVLWSVGTNGRDDGGNAVLLGSFTERDVAWLAP